MAIDLLASNAPAEGGNPTVVIVVAALAVLGTIATALAPTFTEMVKTRRRGAAEPSAPPVQPGAEPIGDPRPPPVASPANALTPVVQTGIDALSMVDAAVRDYRAQRDDALRRVDAPQRQLDDARATISEQLVQMAQLRGRLGQYEPDYGRQPPMYPNYPRHGEPDDWTPR